MRHTPADFLPNPTVCDRVVWTLSADGLFSVKTAWEACRHRKPFQPWHGIIWFTQEVPRWSYIAWLAVWGRLANRDRLGSWGLSFTPQCVLCGMS